MQVDSWIFSLHSLFDVPSDLVISHSFILEADVALLDKATGHLLQVDHELEVAEIVKGARFDR